jgi:hypothetical protein
MASEFPKNPDSSGARASGSGQIPPGKPTGAEAFEFGEPNQPPAGLMRKRSHIVFWILLALALGLLLAGFMVLVES